jgi:hemin uptake protein HemP
MNALSPLDAFERVAGGSSALRPAGAGVAAVRPAATIGERGFAAQAARRRWNSRQLLGDDQEIEIAHADSVYRLRITSLGKLILTK